MERNIIRYEQVRIHLSCGLGFIIILPTPPTCPLTRRLQLHVNQKWKSRLEEQGFHIPDFDAIMVVEEGDYR